MYAHHYTRYATCSLSSSWGVPKAGRAGGGSRGMSRRGLCWSGLASQGHSGGGRSWLAAAQRSRSASRRHRASLCGQSWVPSRRY